MGWKETNGTTAFGSSECGAGVAPVRIKGGNNMKRRWLTLALAGVAILLLFVVGASANLTGSTFEGNDGNLVVNTPGNTDWDTPAPNLSAANDVDTGTGDNSFGQGTSQSDVNVTVVSGSIPNSKADLARFAVAGETVGANSFLYLAWARNNDAGSTNFDFEINKLAQPNLTTPGAKVLNRATGDVLISYSYQGNNLVPSLSLRTWGASGWSGPTDLSGCSEGHGNDATVQDDIISPTVARTTGRFGEAAINLTCAGIVPAGACEGFTSAHVSSRASQSFNSEVKDFIAPVALSFSNCGAIKVTKTTKVPGMTGPQPQAGVNFSLDGGTAVPTGADGTVCFNAVALGNHSVTETVPAGYQADGPTTKTVNVQAVGSCDSGATAVSFSNSPLTDVTISVDSKADGGTASSVDCSDNSLDFSTGTNGDGSKTSDQIAGSKTITCTITIDP
jgi:hypothetical protein